MPSRYWRLWRTSNERFGAADRQPDEAFPKVQIITVEELLNDKRPSMPNALLPYFQAQRRYATTEQQELGFEA